MVCRGKVEVLVDWSLLWHLDEGIGRDGERLGGIGEESWVKGIDCVSYGVLYTVNIESSSGVDREISMMLFMVSRELLLTTFVSSWISVNLVGGRDKVESSLASLLGDGRSLNFIDRGIKPYV